MEPGIESFRLFLLGLLTEAKEFDKKASTPTVKAVIDANRRLLERMIVFISNSIKEGVMDMEKAKSEIKVLDEGVIEEIGRAKREAPVQNRIVELASKLKPGRYIKVDPEGIDPGNFTTKVHNLRGKLIPLDVKPKRNINGESGLFLVRLTEKQMALEPAPRVRKKNGSKED